MTEPAPHETALKLAIQLAGSEGKLAAICGCTRPAISATRKARRPLSPAYALKVEEALGIDRRVLNPTVYPKE